MNLPEPYRSVTMDISPAGRTTSMVLGILAGAGLVVGGIWLARSGLADAPAVVRALVVAGGVMLGAIFLHLAYRQTQRVPGFYFYDDRIETNIGLVGRTRTFTRVEVESFELRRPSKLVRAISWLDFPSRFAARIVRLLTVTGVDGRVQKVPITDQYGLRGEDVLSACRAWLKKK